MVQPEIEIMLSKYVSFFNYDPQLVAGLNIYFGRYPTMTSVLSNRLIKVKVLIAGNCCLTQMLIITVKFHINDVFLHH